MWIGCDGCPIQGSARAAAYCHTCVLPAFVELRSRGPAPVSERAERDADEAEQTVPLDRAERAAVTALVGAGLITPQVAAAARARPNRPDRRVAG